MRQTARAVILSLTALALGLSSGCSDYGSTGPAAAKMVTGVAATGAPVVGAVTLKDSSPIPAELTTTTASDGSFAFNANGLTPPFIIRTTAGGARMFSLATDTGIANLTPLTTMALAHAAMGADLDQLYDKHAQGDINSAAAKMADSVIAVQKTLEPLMESFGVSVNILSGQFSANHSGMDALLDAISVSINAGTVTITNKQNNAVMINCPSVNIGSSTLVVSNLPTPSPAPALSSGTALYTTKCAGCHGDVANSTLKGRASITAIQGAIGSNFGGMGILSSLSITDMQSIVDLFSAAPQPGNVTTSPATPSTPSMPSMPDGAALYAANCAGCHGALANSRKQGATVVRIQNAISGNVGGMSTRSNLAAADIQAIVTALNPPGSTPASVLAPAPSPSLNPAPSTAPDGAALYAANCAGCHGALGNSSKQGITIALLQTAIASNTGGMNFLSTLTATQQQAIVTALNVSIPAPTPVPGPTPTPTPVPDGAALYATNCAGCHGQLAASTKQGITIARLQTAIAGNTGGVMGSLSRLTVSEIQAIVTVLTPATPTPTPTTPAPVPSPVLDGTALYTANCVGCHGPLASSAKAGATASRIQSAISANTGGMGFLSSFTSAQIKAISGALATIPPSSTTLPACGSCHAIPPATGHHSTHKSEGIACATCHGAGYSTTTFNAATHNNGVKNLTSTIGWNATNGTCSNSCHNTHTW